MFKWFDDFLKPYQVPGNYEISVFDNDGNKHSLVGLCASLAKEVIKLEQRITKLEAENVETTNCLYEIMQSIDEVNIKIDKIHPVIYNLHQKE